jgi:hypothetical protein
VSHTRVCFGRVLAKVSGSPIVRLARGVRYKYYKEYKIITLYMPPYLLYLLQLLNIDYFALLKQAYYTELNS